MEKRKVFETDFTIFYHYPEYEIGEFYYTPSTASMTEDQYKEEGSKVVEMIDELALRGFLGDLSDFAFIITPELQDWTSDVLTKRCIEYGLERYAMLVPNEFYTKISNEQAVEEFFEVGMDEVFRTSYFDNRDRAVEWLIGSTE